MIRWLRNFPMILRSLVMTILAVVVLLAFFAFLGSDALDDSTFQSQQMQLRTAGLAAESVDSQLENYFRALALQSGELAGRIDDPNAVQESLRHLSESGLFPGGVFCLDFLGRVAASEPDLTEAEAEAVRLSSAVQQALRTGLRHTGDFDLGTAGVPLILLLEPVTDGQGTIQGWLGGSADANALPLREFSQLLAKQTGSRSAVIDSTGNSLTLGKDGNLAVNPAAHYAELLPFLEGGEAGITRLEKTEIGTDESIIAVISPLKNAPWTVLIESPESEVYGLLTKLRWQFVYFGALILAVAIVSAWFFEEVILGPIRMLLQATRRLAAGDLTTPVRIEGRDETAQLSQEFEAMRLKMADNSKNYPCRCNTYIQDC